jgi:hypothetical protein
MSTWFGRVLRCVGTACSLVDGMGLAAVHCCGAKTVGMHQPTLSPTQMHVHDTLHALTHPPCHGYFTRRYVHRGYADTTCPSLCVLSGGPRGRGAARGRPGGGGGGRSSRRAQRGSGQHAAQGPGEAAISPPLPAM